MRSAAGDQLHLSYGDTTAASTTASRAYKCLGVPVAPISTRDEHPRRN